MSALTHSRKSSRLRRRQQLQGYQEVLVAHVDANSQRLGGVVVETCINEPLLQDALGRQRSLEEVVQHLNARVLRLQPLTHLSRFVCEMAHPST